MSSTIDDEEGGEALTRWFAKQIKEQEKSKKEQQASSQDNKNLSAIRAKWRKKRLERE